ncbi:MAG: hypothetical protein RI895_1333 [Actinomycetota bacterium]|jgi:uncharacterized surface protein with fasciclin (FAS1) repeats
MISVRKKKGVVAGLLSAALTVSAVGVAYAESVLAPPKKVDSDSVVKKVGTTFELFDLASGNECSDPGPLAQTCEFSVIYPAGLSIDDEDASNLDNSFTFTADEVGIFQVVIAGARSSDGGTTINKTYETTWTIDVRIGDIVDAAIAANPEFETLVLAILKADEVESAGLVEALGADGPFTVFAPTDAAFAALPSGVLTALTTTRVDLLTRILKYHVVSGASILSGDIDDGETTLTTLDEVPDPASMVFGEVIVNRVDDVITVGGKTVVLPDNLATNGVIHGIDGVLIPDDLAEEIAALVTVTPPPSGGDTTPVAPEAKKYTVTVTGYAYKKTGNSTLDERRSAAVSSYLQSLGLDSTNSTYSEVGTELRKNTRSARSAVVSVTYMKDGASVTVKKRIYFTAKKSTLSKSSKAKLNAFVSSVK